MAGKETYAPKGWPSGNQTNKMSYQNRYNDDLSYSNDSASSRLSYTTTSGASPMSYGDEYLGVHKTLSIGNVPASLTAKFEGGEGYGTTRVTLSTMGWPPLHQFPDMYKFVVPTGKEPYFELLPKCVDTSNLPERIYLDAPKNPKKNVFPCQYPGGCDEKVFTRPADLERHYRNVHTVEQRETFVWDYASCERVRDPFTRKDHFRDHLRDYHKEDIGAAGNIRMRLCLLRESQRSIYSQRPFPRPPPRLPQGRYRRR